MPLVVAHQILQPQSSDASETSVAEYMNSLGTLNAETPGLAILNKNTTNCGIVHLPLEGKLKVMAAPQVL